MHLFISNPFCFRACHFLTVTKLGNLVVPNPRVVQFLPELSFASFPLTEKPGIFSRTLGPCCPLRVCWVMDTTGWQCSSHVGWEQSCSCRKRCPVQDGWQTWLYPVLMKVPFMSRNVHSRGGCWVPQRDAGAAGGPSPSANQSTFPREVLV